MKKLPESDIDCSELWADLYALVRSKLLLAGIELKVFNVLVEPRTAENVAQDLGAHPGNMEIFLDALVACDLLRKKNSLYWNSAVAQAFLVEDSPTYLGTLVIRSSQMMQSGLDDLPALVKKGPPPPSKNVDMGSEYVWVQLAGSLANYARAGTAQQVVEVISALPEFPSFGKNAGSGRRPGYLWHRHCVRASKHEGCNL